MTEMNKQNSFDSLSRFLSIIHLTTGRDLDGAKSAKRQKCQTLIKHRIKQENSKKSYYSVRLKIALTSTDHTQTQL